MNKSRIAKWGATVGLLAAALPAIASSSSGSSVPTREPPPICQILPWICPPPPLAPPPK